MRRRSAAVLAVALTAALVTEVGPAHAAQRRVLLAESFEGYAPNQLWRNQTAYGKWFVNYAGFGGIAVEQSRSRVLALKPKASTRASETHAAQVVSRQRFGDFDMTLRLHTARQLRTPRPRAWEVAWVLWHYLDDNHFYYLVLKPTGWEIGKADPAYPGGQRYLVTQDEIRFPTGRWHDVRIRQEGSTMTVWANGRKLRTLTDTRAPYLSGRMGLYTEDAYVHFDNVWVTTAH